MEAESAAHIVHYSFACLSPPGEAITEAGLDFIERTVLRGGELRSEERAALSVILDGVEAAPSGSAVRTRIRSLRARYGLAPA
jgi:hypothetical protein